MFADSGNASIFYETAVDGEPVVMLAGFGATHHYWSKAPACLPGYRIITMDNRGVGRTVYDGEFDTSDQADDVIAVMDAAGVGKAHIVGWSMGSVIARNLACRYPERVEDLVLVGTFVDIPLRSEYILNKITSMTVLGEIPLKCFYVMINSFCFSEETFRRFSDEGHEPPIPREFQDPAGLMYQLKAIDVKDRCTDDRDIRAPTLIVHGAEDIMVPPSEGRKMTRLIEGSELVLLEGQAHSIPLKAYSDRLLGFFRKHPVSRRRLSDGRPRFSRICPS